MRSPGYKSFPGWWGGALLALAIGLLPAQWDNKAAGRAGMNTIPTANSVGGGGAFHEPVTAGHFLRLLPRGRSWGFSDTSVVAMQERGSGNESKVRIRHPRQDGKMLPIFVASVKIRASKNHFKNDDVTALLTDASPTAKEWQGRVLAIDGGEAVQHSRVFILLKATHPGVNPHKLTINFRLNGMSHTDYKQFDIVQRKGAGGGGAGKANAQNNKENPKRIEGKRAPGPQRAKTIDLYYPADGHKVSGDEKSYFVPCEPSGSSLDYVNLGGAQGVRHFDDSNPMEKIWWVEFTGLGTIPGPDETNGYQLVVVNQGGEPLDPTTIYIAE